MGIGSIGSSSLNQLLSAAVKMQAIGRDSSISDGAKRRIIDALKLQTSGIIGAAKQDEKESIQSQLVASAEMTNPTPIASNAALGPGKSAASAPAPPRPPASNGLGHAGAEGLARGITIDKVG